MTDLAAAAVIVSFAGFVIAALVFRSRIANSANALALSQDKVAMAGKALEALSIRAAVAEERSIKLVQMQSEIDRLRGLEIEYERLKSSVDERELSLKARADELEGRFTQLAGAALERSQALFLTRAEETFKRHREAADANVRDSANQIEKIILPMQETLSKYDEKLVEIERLRATAYGSIVSAISEVKAGQEKVQGEAARLSHALRNAPKARGRWGEHQLRQVLEMAGLVAGVDYHAEVTVDGEDGRLRPDMIINLPGDKILVIDAKCPLTSYQDAVACSDEEEMAGLLRAHAAALKAHVNALAKKAYWDQFEEAPDFVLMFIPGENFLAAALESDQDLFEYALGRRVLLASPTNLIAIARTVAMVWRQERLAEDAKKVGALGKELYERLATMGSHVSKLGRNLDSAMQAYNQVVGSLESQVLTSARRMRDLNIEPPRKSIDQLATVDTNARALSKLETE